MTSDGATMGGASYRRGWLHPVKDGRNLVRREAAPGGDFLSKRRSVGTTINPKHTGLQFSKPIQTYGPCGLRNPLSDTDRYYGSKVRYKSLLARARLFLQTPVGERVEDGQAIQRTNARGDRQ